MGEIALIHVDMISKGGGEAVAMNVPEAQADLPMRRLVRHGAEERPFHVFEDRLDRHREDRADGHDHLINVVAKALAEEGQPSVGLDQAHWTLDLVNRVREAAGASVGKRRGSSDGGFS